MNITASFLLLSIFTLLYTAIIEIFTILFRLTGLTQEKAKTQVISLLTNSGFTTTESENILSSRRRRKLAQITMLFGYSFTAIILSIVVNMFLSLSQSELVDLFPVVGILAASILFCLIVFRLKPIRALLDRCLERIGNRIMFGSSSNTLILVDLYGTNAIVEVLLEHTLTGIADIPLSDCGLRENLGIHILHIKRMKEDNVKINGETVLKQGDSVLVFGNYKNIRKAFENTAENTIK